MHEHSPQVLFLEVFLLGAVPQLVQNPGFSSLDKAVKNQTNRLAAMFSRPGVFFALGDSELLPFLEESCNVEVPHALNNLIELLDSTFLKQAKTLHFIPALFQPHKPVLLNYLSIAAPKH